MYLLFIYINILSALCMVDLCYYLQSFPHWGKGGSSSPLAKYLLMPPPGKTPPNRPPHQEKSSPVASPHQVLISLLHQRFIPPYQIQFLCYNPIKNLILSYRHGKRLVVFIILNRLIAANIDRLVNLID